MTESQDHLLRTLKRTSAYLERCRKRQGDVPRSAEQDVLDALIAAFRADAREQAARTRDLRRLQREKDALTAQLHQGHDGSTLAAGTQLMLIAALKTVEQQRRVQLLRRLAATAALTLHERAGRGILRALNRMMRLGLIGTDSTRTDSERGQRAAYH